MKLYELSQLPFKERFKIVNNLVESDSELHPDAKIVTDIFEDTIDWFQKPTNQRDPNLLSKLKDTKEELPSFFETIYEIMEKSVLGKLPSNERQRIFDDSKESWCIHYPEFRRISDIMETFKTNEMLLEYAKQSPPPSIHDRAIEAYKKCISFKVKFTKKILSHLKTHPDTPHIHYYRSGIYCINEDTVKKFLMDYQLWIENMRNMWNQAYYLQQDFFYNSCYDRTSWNSYTKYPSMLKEKADEVEMLHTTILTLLNAGKDLLLEHNEAITLEYRTNALEVSLFEREEEIARMRDCDNLADEEYCYVYTLECDLFVFYVGIAANPRERFEQHVRGAFSDEAHLFKSKFILKYHEEIKQKIVFEGTRRECKEFEKSYIAKFNPLGNMTDGGEG